MILLLVCYVNVLLVDSIRSTSGQSPPPREFSPVGPPKLLSYSPDEVWYQPGEDPTTAKFVLSCIASSNTEKYSWTKNGNPLEVSGEVGWVDEGSSGTIEFIRPGPHHIGYYQCKAANIYGTALSNRIHVRLGVLEHFPSEAVEEVKVEETNSLTLACEPRPFGHPTPTIFWLYRHSQQESVIETIKRPHITVDSEGRLHFSSVTQHDGRPFLLYECAASSPVLHGEYRAGHRVRVSVVPRKDKKPIAIHQMFVSPERNIARAGGRLKLQCIFGGFPVPKVKWDRLDGELPVGRMKDLSGAESDFGKSLIIEGVVPEDQGVYTCTSQQITHRMEVIVEAAPFWLETPVDVDVAEGDSAELRCRAGGVPAPLVEWTQNGLPLHALPSSSRYLLLDAGQILRIAPLDHDLDTAVYQCNVSNPRGYVYSNAFINVRAYPPKFLMPSVRVWRVVLRSTVFMDCQVDAAPEAKVQWVDSDDRLLQPINGKSWILPNMTFKISEVNTADEGLYYCNVSNKYGINRAINTLLVYKSTFFKRVPSPRHLTVEAGEHVDLHCEVEADPRLNVTYTWTINGKPLKNDGTHELTNTSLLIQNSRGYHSGRIRCTVDTNVDVKTSEIQLIVRDVPQWPAIEGIKCSERKATISWKRPIEYADPINRYQLEMHTDFHPGKWKIVHEQTDVDHDEFNVDVTLTPWVNYTFRVAAVNSHGRSQEMADMSGETRVCQTRPSFPYTNPIGVRAEGTTPDNLVIRWNPLDKYEWNAPRLQYLIRYKMAGVDTAWTEFIVEDSLANHTIIREVPTFKKFLVQVQAVNSVGASIIDPKTVEGYSGEDVPLTAPQHFRVVEVLNYTSVNFTWEAVEDVSIRGHPRGYQIECTVEEGKNKAIVANVPKGSSWVVLHSFHSLTNYSAVIRTRNIKYRSEPSTRIRFSMPEGLPSKVSSLTATAVGSQAILVTWKPPLKPNGFLRGYFISFDNQHSGTKEVEETYVIHRQLYYLNEHALPEQSYTVSVWGETGAGEGAKTVTVVWTHPVRDPDPPRFRVVNVSHTWIEVEWLPSDGMPGSSFFLNYTQDGRTFLTSAPIYLPNTVIRLKNLIPATPYEIIGVARDINRTTPSVSSIQILTDSFQQPSHLNQESVRSALWFVAVLVALSIALLAVLITCCCERRRSGRYAVKKKEMEIGHQLDIDNEKSYLEYQYRFK